MFIHFRHTGRNLHSCKYCGKVFTRRTKMTEHMISHMHDGKKFECYICLQKFQRLATVRAHFTTKHKLPDAETFRCRYCTKTYLNEKTYRAHLRFVRSCCYALSLGKPNLFTFPLHFISAYWGKTTNFVLTL